MRSNPIAMAWRLALLITGVAGTCLAFFYEFWEGFLMAIVLTIFSIWSLIDFMQRIYKKINFFFEAIRYEDGSLQFREDLSDPSLKGLHENLNRINGIITDIRVREAHSQRFFKEFMKHSASGLLAVDATGFVEVINDSALKMIGLPNMTHLSRLEQHQPDLHALMASLKPEQSEQVKILEDNNLKVVAVKVATIRFSEKEYRIFSMYDIKSEIEENELETWQKLMRIMTHEIMNSIAPIASLSQTLGGYYQKEGGTIPLADLDQITIDNTVKGLNVIEERSSGLRGFVDNYRKLSRIPEPEFGTIQINNWLESIQLLFSGQQEEHHVSLKVRNTYKQTSFSGDERLLTHVVLNLLNNAVQALENTESKIIEITMEASNSGTLLLKVSDNGKGYLPEEHDKLFLPFYTSRENGSGIGLSLSKQIMRKHKGGIYSSSEPGVKTEFVLAF